MRAIVMKEYGGPECLVPAERPDPVAKPGWAVVRQGEPVPGAGGLRGGPLRRPVVAAGGAGAVTRRARLRRRPRLDRDLAAVDRRAAPGRLVVLGASRAERANLDVRRFYFGQFDLLGTTMGSTRDFAGLLAVLDAYDVPPPVVDRTFPRPTS